MRCTDIAIAWFLTPMPPALPKPHALSGEIVALCLARLQSPSLRTPVSRKRCAVPRGDFRRGYFLVRISAPTPDGRPTPCAILVEIRTNGISRSGLPVSRRPKFPTPRDFSRKSGRIAILIEIPDVGADSFPDFVCDLHRAWGLYLSRLVYSTPRPP